MVKEGLEAKRSLASEKSMLQLSIKINKLFNHSKEHKMELTEKMIEQLKADLAKVKTYDDLMGKDRAIKKFIANT